MVPGFILVDFLLHVESVSSCVMLTFTTCLFLFPRSSSVCACVSFALVFVLSVCVLPLLFIGSFVFVLCLLRLLSSFASSPVLVCPLCYRFVIRGF